MIILAVIVVVALVLVLLPRLLEPERMELSPEVRAGTVGDFIELPLGIVHYELSGPETGQVVVLVSGFSTPYFIWDPTFDALVKAGFRVLRFDLFGRGYSARPYVSYDRRYFEMQLTQLLDYLKIPDPVDLIGVSIGAAITAGFTAKSPECVRKLAWIAPFHAPTSFGFGTFFHIPGVGEYLASVLLAPTLPRTLMAGFYKPRKFRGLRARFREQMRYKGFRRAQLTTLRNFASQDQLGVYEQVGRLDKPVLLIWGKEDKTVPFAGNERILDIVKADFLAVDAARHLVYYERPDVVNPGLIEFLEKDVEVAETYKLRIAS
ncbi:MAG: alpha/beta hydrolase [Desulfobacterales bacterium]|nr:alpha/beta hydrolase [Desulfobacterales bacterium]